MVRFIFDEKLVDELSSYGTLRMSTVVSFCCIGLREVKERPNCFLVLKSVLFRVVSFVSERISSLFHKKDIDLAVQHTTVSIIAVFVC